MHSICEQGKRMKTANTAEITKEENILWSFAPHDISMILLLANDEPQSVMTTGGNYLHQQIADVTTTYPELRSGIDNRPHGKKLSRRLGV